MTAPFVMQIYETPLAGLSRVLLTPHADERGTFTRWFCADELQDVFDGRQVVQANHSRTATVGAIRGLHYQIPPHAEMKLIRCVRGRVFDVAVDLRRGSETFLHWHAVELTEADRQLIVIPEGFAHGFQVLEADSELLYLHTARYTPDSEKGLRFDDPALAIRWPLAAEGLSPRDAAQPYLTEAFTGLDVGRA